MSQGTGATSAAELTFRLWRTLADATAEATVKATPVTRALTPSPATAGTPRTREGPPKMAVVVPRDLQYLIAEAQRTGLFDVPLDRAVRRILAQCLIDCAMDTSCEWPDPAILARVVVVRSGAMSVLRQLLNRLLHVRPDAAVYVVCHAKDLAAVNELCPSADLRPIAYPCPQVGTLDPEVLRSLLADRIPADVQAGFYLDNNADGDGAEVAHVETALLTRQFQRVFRFQAGGRLHDVLTVHWAPELKAAIPALLRWWDPSVFAISASNTMPSKHRSETRS